MPNQGQGVGRPPDDRWKYGYELVASFPSETMYPPDYRHLEGVIDFHMHVGFSRIDPMSQLLTGSLPGVKPVKSVDRRSIGTGVAGPVTLRLQELYISTMYGRLPKYRHWLTPVPV